MKSVFLSGNIRYIREKARMTQVEVAKLFNVSRGQVASYEKVTTPGMDFLVEYANYFNISIDDLIRRDLKDDSLQYPDNDPKSEFSEPPQQYQSRTRELLRKQEELIKVLKEQLKDKDKMIRLLEEKIDYLGKSKGE